MSLLHPTHVALLSLALLTLSTTQANAVEITVGGGLAYGPKYEGAKKFEFSPFPLLSVQGENWFLGSEDNLASAGIYYPITAAWNIGLVGSYQGGRKAKDDDRLRGTSDLNNHGILGIYSQYQYERWGFNLAYYQATKKDYGAGALASISWLAWQSDSENTSLSFETFAQWSNKKALNTYFGVTPQEAQASGGQLHAYSIDKSGLRSYGASVTLTHRITANWTSSFDVGIYSIAGKAKRSPLVEKRQAAVASMGISYTF